MFLLLLSFDYCSTSFVPEPEVQLQHNIHLDELPCLSSIRVTCLFVKLHLINRLCNLSNEIIDNYSFQQKRVNCSKVSGYQQRNTDQRGPSDSGTTHYSLPDGQHSMVQRKRQQASLVVLQRWTPCDDLVAG